jgi:hypothetical protein
MPADFLTTKFHTAALHMANFHAAALHMANFHTAALRMANFHTAAGASTLEEEGTDENEPSRPGSIQYFPFSFNDIRMQRGVTNPSVVDGYATEFILFNL